MEQNISTAREEVPTNIFDGDLPHMLENFYTYLLMVEVF